MCGICGVIGGEPGVELPRVRRMAEAIAHRGPDDEGFHVSDPAVLGNRRLEIIDLEGGHQPLSNEDGSVWITYNGEIYNYVELRRDLQAAGHRFRTRTDTEVIVHLYEEHGADCVRRLRGMFAFAIWDERRRRLFGARDRFGQKPFFYAVRDARLIFASEIKGLLAHPDVGVDPEPAAIDYYLTFRFVPPPLTLFRGISKLPAGHRLSWEAGEVAVEPYWEASFEPGPKRPEREWIEELEARLDDAVRSHLVADVEVGALLSGGLDSSTITAFMARHSDRPPPTFCIGSRSATFDERPHARQVAERFGTLHREREVTPEQLRAIPRLVRCLDEPSDPISACFFEAARLASEHVKVVLGGDGGDEMFGGFDRYAAFGWVGWYRHLPRSVREGIVAPAVRRLRVTFGYKSLAQKARWAIAVGEAEGGDRYARMNSYFRFGREWRDELYGPGLEDVLRGPAAEEAVARPFREAPASDALHRMIFTDLVTRLPEHTLMLSDRLSMAHGLEARSPLLDDELAAFCDTMPPDLKVRRRVTKYALRRVARGLLPEEIVERPKQGFMFPVAFWLNAEAAPAIRAALTSGPLVEEGWIRPEAVGRLLQEHLERRDDHHVRIWLLQSLDAWYRIYVAGEEMAAAAEVAGGEPAGRRG